MVPIQLDRGEQIARFYVGHADRLRRAIAGKTIGLDASVIEDACALAWERLLSRPDIDLDRHEAYWWLYRVALRNAWALGRRERREQPAGSLSGADDETQEPEAIDADVVVSNARACARYSASFTGASAASCCSTRTA